MPYQSLVLQNPHHREKSIESGRKPVAHNFSGNWSASAKQSRVPLQSIPAELIGSFPTSAGEPQHGKYGHLPEAPEG